MLDFNIQFQFDPLPYHLRFFPAPTPYRFVLVFTVRSKNVLKTV